MEYKYYFTKKGTSKIQSVLAGTTAATSTISSNLSQLANKSRTTVQNAASDLFDVAATAAEKGIMQEDVRGDVKSVAMNVASDLSNFTRKGTLEVKYAAMNVVSNLSDLTQIGTSNVKSFANMTTSKVTNLADIGTWDSKYVANATTTQLQNNINLNLNLNIINAKNIVQWIDEQAKNGTTAMNAQTSKIILGFTGKGEYKFGDVTKEVIRRIASGDYNMGDITVLLKLLLTVGVSIGPLAKALPIAVLLDALNVSWEKQVSVGLVLNRYIVTYSCCRSRECESSRSRTYHCYMQSVFGWDRILLN